jgi:hypothetical protein
VDKRGACIVLDRGNGWRCVSNGGRPCSAGGDNLALIAAVLGCEFKGPGVATVRMWVDGHLFSAMPAESLESIGDHALSRSPPPRREVDRVWSGCGSVLQSAEARHWLCAHAIDPALVAAADLARVLPGYLELDGWARRGRQSWFDSGHRLVVRLWQPGSDGVFEPVSLHARTIGSDATKDKARFPKGCSAAGLVLACGPEPFGECGAPEPEARACLTIVEGVPDFLLWATRPATVRGGLLGSVTAAAAPGLFRGLPAGCRVALRHHGDAGGELHRAGLRRVLGGGANVC